jgi:hypothetical protein
MTVDRRLVFSILMLAMSAAGAEPAQAQACSRVGADVICDDGRRGVWSGDAILACSQARARARCRWKIRARRKRRVVLFSMVCRIVIRMMAQLERAIDTARLN